MKQAIIMHGWYGHPQEGWLPWLKKELERKGYRVDVPAMPEPDKPRISPWVATIKSIATDELSLMVGHSVGCQTILRYLATTSKQVEAIVLVAPWTRLTPAATAEEGEEEVARPWLNTPIDWEKAKVAAKRFVAIFSDDDPYVPITEADVFKKNLGAKVVIEHGKGHLSGEDGVTQLPAILDDN